MREKRAPGMIGELLEEATRRLQTKGLRPPLLVAARLAAEEHQVLPTPRREIRQVRAALPRALFALQESLWARRARAFFAPGRKL